MLDFLDRTVNFFFSFHIPSFIYLFCFLPLPPVAQMIKNPPAIWETRVWSLGQEDPLGGGHSNPLQYSCQENPHGQKSLAGYSPWGRKESDRTEGLGTTILLSGVFPQLYLLTSYWVFLLVCLLKYSFIWLLRVLVAAHGVLVVTCGI